MIHQVRILIPHLINVPLHREVVLGQGDILLPDFLQGLREREMSACKFHIITITVHQYVCTSVCLYISAHHWHVLVTSDNRICSSATPSALIDMPH